MTHTPEKWYVGHEDELKSYLGQGVDVRDF
jgi:hypothetical protein